MLALMMFYIHTFVLFWAFIEHYNLIYSILLTTNENWDLRRWMMVVVGDRVGRHAKAAGSLLILHKMFEFWVSGSAKYPVA